MTQKTTKTLKLKNKKQYEDQKKRPVFGAFFSIENYGEYVITYKKVNQKINNPN